jgi:hypothetical protein
VDGITAALDELEDSVKPSIPTRDFGGKVRSQAQLDEPDNISDI